MHNVIRVRFHNQDDNDYFFGSLAAIYQVFTPEQIGCNVKNLWNYKIEVGKPKVTKKCIISKHVVVRQPQKNKR